MFHIKQTNGRDYVFQPQKGFEICIRTYDVSQSENTIVINDSKLKYEQKRNMRHQDNLQTKSRFSAPAVNKGTFKNLRKEK